MGDDSTPATINHLLSYNVSTDISAFSNTPQVEGVAVSKDIVFPVILPVFKCRVGTTDV